MVNRIVAVALGLVAAAALSHAADPKPASESGRYFELRKYHAMPGRLADLDTRFGDHTCSLFRKHGMEIVGFWRPAEGPEAENVLVYVLAYPSRDAREAAWKAFREDPEWIKAKDESEKSGPLVAKVESTFMHATDYSPIK